MKTMNDCEHELEEVEKKDSDMLSGIWRYEKCKKCGMKRFSPKINIRWFLLQMCRDLDIDYDELTPKIISTVGHLQFPYVIRDVYGEKYDDEGNRIKRGKILEVNWARYFTKKLTLKQAKKLLDNPKKFI